MVFSKSRLTTYAKHVNVAHAMHKITSNHDYKIVNAIQEIQMTTVTSSHVLHLSSGNKPHSCSRVLQRFESIVTLLGKIT
jgi:hypothetical protein